ncbi:MAG TPA: MATE family efflux transporter [Bacteroidales bacterium]|nr:MATE family efflux transporter [Bacteroidales bacterium]HRZ49616.1 MATE family efflux transporter [Bacteroidales bacterium]
MKRSTRLIYRKVLYIGLPIVLGSVAQNIILFTDTAFLGRVGEIQLGASAIGGIFYLAFVMLAFGFGIGAQIIMARRFGEGDLKGLGNTYSHAFFFLLIFSGIVFLLFREFSPWLLNHYLASGAVKEESLKFLNYRMYGFFFAYINVTYRAFYIAIGRTMIITWTTVIMTMVNVVLDYGLIFGRLGLPEMGIEGAALASVIAEFSTTLVATLYTLKLGNFKRYFLLQPANLSFRRFVPVFRIASPMMLTNFFSLFVWFFFFMIIEKLGETELAVSQLVRSVYIILLLPVWGFSSATNTMVSYYIGRGRSERVRGLVQRVAVLSAMSVAVVVCLVQLAPSVVLRIYTDQWHLIQGTVPVLRVISGAAICLAVAFTLFNGVSGTGKTVIALVIEVLTLCLYLGFAWMMAHWFDGTVAMVWSAEYLYAVLLATISWLYLRYGNWRRAIV